MAETKTYKCGFRHCQHESCEVSQDEAVKIKNRYYHEDCAKIYSNIEELKRLYYEKISNTVVMPQLMSVINNIIFKKKVDSNYFVFAVKYAINTKRKINYPQGLHYIIDDYRIKDAWKKKQLQSISKAKFEAKSNDEPMFQVKKTKEKGLDNLFD